MLAEHTLTTCITALENTALRGGECWEAQTRTHPRSDGAFLQTQRRIHASEAPQSVAAGPSRDGAAMRGRWQGVRRGAHEVRRQVVDLRLVPPTSARAVDEGSVGGVSESRPQEQAFEIRTALRLERKDL